MKSADVEDRRIAALRAYGLLDRQSEPLFDGIAQLAARVADAPMGLVAFVDRTRKCFKARYHFDHLEVTHPGSFCDAIVSTNQPLAISDTHHDERFCRYPLVVGAPFVRYYVGVPVRDPASGQAIGVVAAQGAKPRPVDGETVRSLELLARQLEALLAGRLGAQGEPATAESLEHRYLRALLDTAPVGLAVCDPDRGVRVANAEFERLLCAGAGEHDGARVLLTWTGATVPARQLPHHVGTLAGAPISKRVVGVLRENGETLWLRIDATPLHAPPRAVAIALSDTTQQRTIETRAEEHQATLRAVLNVAVDSVIIIDERGVIEDVNASVQRMFGYAREELVGENVRRLMPSPDHERHDQYLDAYQRTGVRKVIGVPRKVTALRRDGTTFAAELVVNEFRVATQRRYAGVLRDESERKAIERHVAETEQRLRTAVAFDLHDSVGQLLVGARLLGQNLLRDLPDELHPRMGRIVELNSEVLDKVRSLSQSLATVELTSAGFAQALREVAARADRTFGVQCTVEIAPGVPEPPREQAGQAFLVSREAVLNAAKHSLSPEVQVIFDTDGSWYRVRVRDDGKGIDDGAGRAGLGLHSMEYRARLIGGSLRVERRSEGGTEVELRWPLHP